MGNSVITMTNITKRFKKAEVVKNFSLDVKKGSITGLIGPNGAGKTTIMKILAGLMFQTSGELSFYGSRDDLDLNRRRMSFMIEAPIVDYNMTAYENLGHGQKEGAQVLPWHETETGHCNGSPHKARGAGAGRARKRS